jgi:hypothetical protein
MNHLVLHRAQQLLSRQPIIHVNHSAIRKTMHTIGQTLRNNLNHYQPQTVEPNGLTRRHNSKGADRQLIEWMF